MEASRGCCERPAADSRYCSGEERWGVEASGHCTVLGEGRDAGVPVCACIPWEQISCVLIEDHIVTSKKFLRISSSPHPTLPNDNYDAPEEVGGGRKLFHRPLKK